jgi:glycosyltransferase involved in cell wall biosynthesis
MKVCMLAEGLPPAFGGAARQALQLAKQLRGQGIGVFFIGAQIVRESPREDVLDGFKVYRVPHAQRGKWTKLRGVLACWRIFWRERREFDVLHLHSAHYLTLAAAMFAKFVLGKRLLIKMTSIASDTPSAVLRRSYPRLTWWMYQRADAWVCMSRAQHEDCQRHGLPAERLFLIPNGVDARRFHPAASETERAELLTRLGLSPADKHVLFIGTIERDKGVELLVDAASLVYRDHRDVKFLLVGPDGSAPGEGHVRAEFVAGLRQKIEAAGLHERVVLLGHRTNVDEYLRVSTLFAFPSRSEGFGTVLIEAMASGLPCVALNIPGVTSDIITTDRDGIIVEREDPNTFAAVILRLVQDEPSRTRLGAFARETALHKFDLSRIAQQYAELYQRMSSIG